MSFSSLFWLWALQRYSFVCTGFYWKGSSKPTLRWQTETVNTVEHVTVEEQDVPRMSQWGELSKTRWNIGHLSGLWNINRSAWIVHLLSSNDPTRNLCNTHIDYMRPDQNLMEHKCPWKLEDACEIANMEPKLTLCLTGESSLHFSLSTCNLLICQVFTREQFYRPLWASAGKLCLNSLFQWRRNV